MAGLNHNGVITIDDDPDDDTTPDLEIIEEEQPLSEIREAIKIHKIFPNCKFSDIRKLLVKHRFAKNRMQIVTNQLLLNTNDDLPAEGSDEEVIFCPIPSKQSKQGTHTLSGLPKPHTMTKVGYSNIANCTIVRPEQQEDQDREAENQGLPLTVTPTRIPSQSSAPEAKTRNVKDIKGRCLRPRFERTEIDKASKAAEAHDNASTATVTFKIPPTFASALTVRATKIVPKKPKAKVSINVKALMDTNQLLLNTKIDSPAEGRDEEVIFCPIPSKKSKLRTDPPSDLPKPHNMTDIGYSKIANEFEEYLPKKKKKLGNANCTIVRPEQQEVQEKEAENQGLPLTVTTTGIPSQSSAPGAKMRDVKVLRWFNRPVLELAACDRALKAAEVLDNAGTATATFKIPPTFAGAVTATTKNQKKVPQKSKAKVSTNQGFPLFRIKCVPRPRINEKVPTKSTGASKKTGRKVAPPHKFLKQLREVFPDVEVAFLERQCAKQADNGTLESLVEKILNQQDLPLKPKVEINSDLIDVIPKNTEEDKKAAFQSFKAIFPDADPEYLESQYESFGTDSGMLQRFVHDALEKKNYPSQESYRKRQAQFALEKLYKENFDMLKFLELFPDPFKHFQDPEKLPAPMRPMPAGRAFLMARYRTIRCVTIDKVYKSNQWMLYPTCKELDLSEESMKPRPNHEIICAVYKSENNIGFLQEVTFIENEDKIKKHLQEIEEAKSKALAEARSKGELLTCKCCFDEEVLFVDIVTCEEGHLFCKDCVKKGAEIQIGQGKTDFPCLEHCASSIRLEKLEAVLKPSVFARLAQRKQMEELMEAGIEWFDTCPFCDFGMILNPEDRIFPCQNPPCLKQSCRLCKEVSHIPLRCDEVEKSEEVKARTYIEDQMTQALIRECWKCGKKFVKSDGCNKMTCSCGALMCYVCRKPVTDYSHFNGQGGGAIEKCPLFSSNNQLHVEEVAKVARKAKKEISAKNPELSLKHDPTLILPEKVAEPKLLMDRFLIPNLNIPQYQCRF